MRNFEALSVYPLKSRLRCGCVYAPVREMSRQLTCRQPGSASVCTSARGRECKVKAVGMLQDGRGLARASTEGQQKGERVVNVHV